MKDLNRVYWNEQFKILQDTWSKSNDFEKCIDIFLAIHGMVHSSQVSPTTFSFEDELWNKMNESAFRKLFIEEQSIAWKLWHSARIEDITMNILIANESQVMTNGDWTEKLSINFYDTGNAMNENEIEQLSNSIEMEALRGYRNSVGLRTIEIVKSLKPEELKNRVEPSRLKRLLDEGAVHNEAAWLLDYWGKKTYSGLLLMPASRHLFVHLNESFRLLAKRAR
ncbi:MAG: DinB family protein [Clostridia bacterium]|nr:DinB family protein [Clostridia bacterium]